MIAFNRGPFVEGTMKLGRALTVAAILAGLSPGFAERAAGSGDEFLARLLGGLYREGESFACFSRQYDAAHLAAHPGQRVTFVKALVSAYFRESPIAAGRGAYAYQVSLAFRFRDRSETLPQVAECGDAKDSLRYGASCAGPGVAGMRLALEGDRSVAIAIPGGADLWAPGPIDKRHDTVRNPFGPDDEVFRLDRTDVSQCEDLAFDRQKPLRPHEP